MIRKVEIYLSGGALLFLVLFLWLVWFAYPAHAMAATAATCTVVGGGAYCTTQSGIPNGNAVEFHGYYPDTSNPITNGSGYSPWSVCSDPTSGCVWSGVNFGLPMVPAPVWYGISGTWSSEPSYSDPNSFQYFFQFDGSGQPYIPPTTNTTNIVINEPTQGTTTESTTLPIDITYNIGDTTLFSLNGTSPTRIGIDLLLQNTATNQQIDLGTDYSIDSSTGSHDYATTTTQIAGDYTILAQLIGDYGFTPARSDCVPLPPFVTCTGVQNSATLASSLPPVTFSLDNGTFPLLGFDTSSTTSRNGLATTTCDVVHIAGCFQNATVFLFYPDPSALAEFNFLWFNIKTKPPFGYVTQTITALSGANASSTAAFSFPTLPFMDTIFTPLRTGLGALLWLIFGVSFYKRLKDIDL